MDTPFLSPTTWSGVVQSPLIRCHTTFLSVLDVDSNSSNGAYDWGSGHDTRGIDARTVWPTRSDAACRQEAPAWVRRSTGSRVFARCCPHRKVGSPHRAPSRPRSSISPSRLSSLGVPVPKALNGPRAGPPSTGPPGTAPRDPRRTVTRDHARRDTRTPDSNDADTWQHPSRVRAPMDKSCRVARDFSITGLALRSPPRSAQQTTWQPPPVNSS